MTPEGEFAQPPLHGMSIVVWDVPPTVERGETFSVKIGVKCSSECQPNRWTVEVHDHQEEKRASVTVGDEPWPGTAALYFVDADLSAPDAEGLHAWQARATADDDDDDVQHAECATPFRVRVVPTPEYLLTVVASDITSKRPVEGARVSVHPYETFTDERGMAKLRLPRGEYRLFVSGRNHSPFRSEGDMEGDVTIRAELALDRELSDADIWS